MIMIMIGYGYDCNVGCDYELGYACDVDPDYDWGYVSDDV